MPSTKNTPFLLVVGETIAWSVPLFGGLLIIALKTGVFN